MCAQSAAGARRVAAVKWWRDRALLKNEMIQRQCCLTLGRPAIFIDAILCSRECNDTLVSVGIFAHSLAEPRLHNPRVYIDTQATPNFARSPFRETFFREMLLRDVSRKFLVIRYIMKSTKVQNPRRKHAFCVLYTRAKSRE